MTTYRNTSSVPQHVMGPHEAIVEPGETIESEVTLSGVFVVVAEQTKQPKKEVA